MLKDIKGLGEKTIIELEKLDILTIEDLLSYYPFRYNYFKPIPLNKANTEEEIVINGTIESLPKVFYIKRTLNKLSFNLNSDNNIINVTIFNRAFLKNNLNIGKQITLIGKYNIKKNTFTASDIKLTPILNEKIEPVYKLTSKIKKQKDRKSVV